MKHYLLLKKYCCLIPAVIMAIGLTACSTDTMTPQFSQIEIHGRTFNLELALDNRTRYQGLSDRSEIPSDGGMLFVFPYPRQTYFVMRRCLVPIDIIFLDSQGYIVQTHQMTVEPYDTPERELTRYPSVYPTQFVIELKGGTLDDLPLSKGEQIELDYQRLKSLAR